MGFSFLLKMVCVIACIPFYTLLERKVMSYIQARKGPNKVGVLGLLQPVADGVKLMVKEGSFPTAMKYFIYWVGPVLNFMFMLFAWVLFPSFFSVKLIPLSILLFLCWSSVSVYTTLSSGWGSNSKYSFLGAVRGASQSVSYEMGMITVVFMPLLCFKSFSFKQVLDKASYLCFSQGVLIFLFFILMLCETNRSPFDFAEGESELVSGFKTEYSSLSFTFLFLGEYGNMLFASFLYVLFLLPVKAYFLSPSLMFMSVFFLLARATYPRFRYDLLMKLGWKVMLPLSLGLLMLFLFL